MIVHLRREDAHHELKSRKFGPCKVLKKISSNACLIELPSKLNVSSRIFHVHDLYSFERFDDVASINEHHQFPREVTEDCI